MRQTETGIGGQQGLHPRRHVGAIVQIALNRAIKGGDGLLRRRGQSQAATILEHG
jgi:hypothetical protein